MNTKRKDNRLMTARWLTALTIIFAVVLCLSFCVKVTFAAEGDIASGDWWRITSEGELIIGNGGEMTIPISPTSAAAWPWHSYRSQVTSVRFDGTVHSKNSVGYMFNKCNKCTSIDLTGFDTRNATNMQNMFNECSALTILDVSDLNTSAVKIMSNMFDECSALTSLDINNFDTRNVTQMDGLFADCSTLTDINLGEFNTEKAVSMSRMFYNCSSLTSLNVNGFNTSNVVYMQSMFAKCKNLTNLDISSWNTGNVWYMNTMFSDCSALTRLDVSGFDTSNVKNMQCMFQNCEALTTLDVSGWDTNNVNSMKQLFQGCSKLTTLDVSGWDTGNVTEMIDMFSGCSSLASLDVSEWNTEKVTTMYMMFQGCSKLTTLDVSGWNTGKVMRMDNMFQHCSKLTTLDVSGWNTENVTNMTSMFEDCSALTSLEVGGWNTGKVQSMSSMFSNCKKLTNLNVSGWNTENVTTVNSMFMRCNSLIVLDVSGWKIPKLTNLNSTFEYCKALTTLDLSTWNTENVTTTYRMFYNCTSLTSLNLKSFDTRKMANMGSMFINCKSLASITLGENFSFKGNNITSTTSQTYLPVPPSNATYTGKWIRDDESVGPFTSTELRDQYGDNAATWAGTWVWQEKPTTYSITFIPAENTTGSMPIQKAKADEDVTINPCLFKRFNYHLDHWEGSDGSEYADGAVIPANTFAIGDSLTLTAVFAENDNNVNIQDGKFTLTLHGGEKATFDNLPAGLAYQVYEKTPDGWVLLTQTNTAGSIEPLQTSEAYFLNKYQPGTTTATFYGTKIMDGRAAQAGEYTFELLQDETVIQVKQNGDSGFIQFDTIEYDTVGTYTYTIREVPGNNNDIDYDRHEETVTVEVRKDADNNLHAEVSYDTDGVYFVNRTKPGTIVIRKTAEGLTDANKDALFSFRVVLENENGTLVQGGNYHWYVLDANGQIVE